MNSSPTHQSYNIHRRRHHIIGVDDDDEENLSSSSTASISPVRKSPTDFSTTTATTSTSSSSSCLLGSTTPTMENSDDKYSPLQHVQFKKNFQQQRLHQQQYSHPPAIISPDRHNVGSDNASSSSLSSAAAEALSSNLSFFYASRVVALDCEMVGVGPRGQRSVLARVSVVDFFGNCLLDTFVRVQEKVSDYRTHITGIEPHHLSSPEAMPFGMCRDIVRDLTMNKILVGHGLENDLKVLGLDHPWYCTRDTALYRPYMRVDRYGRHSPRRLKDLAQSYLGIIIQQQGISHNPMEDACAAMLLYRNVQSQWDCEIDYRRRNVAFRSWKRGALPRF